MSNELAMRHLEKSGMELFLKWAEAERRIKKSYDLSRQIEDVLTDWSGMDDRTRYETLQKLNSKLLDMLRS